MRTSVAVEFPIRQYRHAAGVQTTVFLNTCYRESFAGRGASQKYNTDGNPFRQPPYQKEVQLWHGNTSIAVTTPAM